MEEEGAHDVSRSQLLWDEAVVEEERRLIEEVFEEEVPLTPTRKRETDLLGFYIRIFRGRGAFLDNVDVRRGWTRTSSWPIIGQSGSRGTTLEGKMLVVREYSGYIFCVKEK